MNKLQLQPKLITEVRGQFIRSNFALLQTIITHSGAIVSNQLIVSVSPFHLEKGKDLRNLKHGGSVAEGEKVPP